MSHHDDLTVICTSCHAENPADRALCHQCGNPLALTPPGAKAKAFRAARENASLSDPPPLLPESVRPPIVEPAPLFETCPVCGSKVVIDLGTCWHCGYRLNGAKDPVDLPRPPVTKPLAAPGKGWTMYLGTGLLVIGLIGVVLGICRENPWLGVPLGFVGLLALLLTIGAVQRRAREFRPMSFEEKILKFLWSGFLITLMIVGVGVAFVASIVIALMVVCNYKPF